jgi:predicted heme/steroid binding protein
MTSEELKQYDGRDGRKAYVAVSGKIYDVSDSPLWSNGDHQGEHQAGCDLTEELKTAPHVRAVIERFAVVGELSLPTTPARGGGSGKLWIVAVLLAALVLLLLLII